MKNFKVFMPLTQNKVMSINFLDYLRINHLKWCTKKGLNTCYAVTSVNNSNYKTSIKMVHRLILNYPKGKIVDHIDGNGLNNCRNNLRICTQAQNMQNQKLRKDNTSKVKGVTHDIVNNKWMAQIQINYKNIKLGRFLNKEDAIKARLEAEIKYFGLFRRRAA